MKILMRFYLLPSLGSKIIQYFTDEGELAQNSVYEECDENGTYAYQNYCYSGCSLQSHFLSV